MSEKYHYLFGPVPSRRLGRSLGIDVTPFKTCSFDCLFCQCGCTTRLVTERSEFVPIEEVCAEIERWLAEDGAADVIAFAGSGEPTLYSRLGELISFIKEKTDIPVIVLSNGTLLPRIAVRDELLEADIVKVSLSAWDEASFKKINRPAPGLSFDQLLSGEREFRSEFNGELWVEVFLMEGENAEPDQVQRIADAVASIRPDKIHLNTAVRPPAEAAVKPVTEEKLRALCGLFTPCAEVIASFAPPEHGTTRDLSADELVELIRRHPATAAQLAASTGASEETIRALLAPLMKGGRLRAETHAGELYYK